MNIKNIFLMIMLGIGVLFTTCKNGGGGGDDPELSIDEKLNGSWSLQSVTVDGVDVTSDFSSFGLTLNYNGPNTGTGHYTINNSNGLLFASGMYTLNGTTSVALSGDDGSTVSAAISLSDGDKVLSFSFNNPTTLYGGGRIEGISGDYIFILKK